MVKKSGLEEISDLAKKSWGIWLVLGFICPFIVIMYIANGGQLEYSDLLYILLIIAILGGALPIRYLWGLIKSKNISKARVTVFFVIGILATFIFISMSVILLIITIGLPQ